MSYRFEEAQWSYKQAEAAGWLTEVNGFVAMQHRRGWELVTFTFGERYIYVKFRKEEEAA